MAGDILVHGANLLAAALFIFGLKLLSSPRTARTGNLLGALGMLLAIAATLLSTQILTVGGILAGILVGGAAGAISAYRVPMTAMPQMVAAFNGFGGAASALVALAEYQRLVVQGATLTPGFTVSVVLGLLIGAVTFSGSMVAFAKLQELMTSAPVLLPARNAVNLVLLLVTLGLLGALVAGVVSLPVLVVAFFLSLLLGVLLVLPIGGADMPVVISLLNSYSGLAGAAAGFVVGNPILIIAGALVGASGLILTDIMCRAMNRSLASVVLGGFGATTAAGAAVAGAARTVRQVQPEEAAVVLGYARSVIIVPGYGLAVSQAQHQLRELAVLLEARGVDVRYAIHPVAGRMPGHMNVLLAEANVPYEQLYDLEAINGEFPRTDVAVVIGANDVVNPSAREDPNSPIYGMPILDVDRARHVLVLKRSLSPGFAGIDNPLFYRENTMMLFGDGKQSLLRLIEAVKEL